MKREERGYIGLLVVLIIGIGITLYFFMQSSPLGHGASDQGVMNALDAKKSAEAVKGMADHRNVEIEEMSQQ